MGTLWASNQRASSDHRTTVSPFLRFESLDSYQPVFTVDSTFGAFTGAAASASRRGRGWQRASTGRSRGFDSDFDAQSLQSRYQFAFGSFRIELVKVASPFLAINSLV